MHFPEFWRLALPDLLNGYDRICAYSCFYIEDVTGAASVDHFVGKAEDWRQVYEWRNYRLVCSLMNSRKLTTSILDPFRG